MMVRIKVSNCLPVASAARIKHGVTIGDVVPVVRVSPDQRKQAQNGKNDAPHAGYVTDSKCVVHYHEYDVFWGTV